MSRLINLFAATASIGLFSGLVYWGVTLSQLDPNEVPVIKRAAGPARIAPDDPGGEQASHQGLSVNTIQAKGGAGDTAMQVVLAPKPRPFQPEDVAGLKAKEVKPAVVKVVEEDEIVAPIAVSATLPVKEDETESVAVQEKSEPVKTEEVKQEVSTPLEPVVKIARPLARPSGLTLAKLSNSKESEPMPKKQVSSELKKGTSLVQIGAFESTEIAQSQWAKFSIKNNDLIGEKKSIIQKAKSNGKTFYRLRVSGFGTSGEAKSFCSALKARGTDCVTTTVR